MPASVGAFAAQSGKPFANPLQQSGGFRAIRLKATSATVGDKTGGLGEEQAVFRVPEHTPSTTLFGNGVVVLLRIKTEQ